MPCDDPLQSTVAPGLHTRLPLATCGCDSPITWPSSCTNIHRLARPLPGPMIARPSHGVAPPNESPTVVTQTTRSCDAAPRVAA